MEYRPVERVEEVNDLLGRAAGREGREADNVAEVDGHTVVVLGGHTAVVFQLIGHAAR